MGSGKGCSKGRERPPFNAQERETAKSKRPAHTLFLRPLFLCPPSFFTAPGSLTVFPAHIFVDSLIFNKVIYKDAYWIVKRVLVLIFTFQKWGLLLLFTTLILWVPWG